ncbi:hypothetical protein ACFQ6V_09480 [Streptomyces roseifaciens]
MLTGIVRRLADGALDSPVIHTLPTTAPASAPAPRGSADDRPVRPHAHWHTVTGPDGQRHLEALWHLAR